MATLRSQSGERYFVLGSHSTVGRALNCDLVLEAQYVSSTHATLRWTGSRWELRDLHSRNGTWLDGRQLQPGEASVLAPRSQLAFGSLEMIWTVDDLEPPLARAESVEGDVVYERDGLLALPSREAPEVQIYQRQDEQWVADRGAYEEEIKDGAVVIAAGVKWTVYLPWIVTHTADATALPASPSTLGLRFIISGDEEHIEIEITSPPSVAGQRMGHRAHNHLLLCLARARLAAPSSQSPGEEGWLYREEVMEQLGIDGNLVNMHLFRARQAFADCGVADAALIVERRRGSGQIRLGVSDITIERF